jgi:DNA-binding CsgD family transcriptional regulator
LDSVNLAVLFLDERGRVVEASASAMEIIRSERGLSRNADGTLCLRDQAGRDLNQWIATGLPPAHNRDGLLHIPRPMARPLSVLVTPLPAINPSWITGDPPRWMLLLFDHDRRVVASTEIIAHDLNISAREAEVGALLATGYDISTVAKRLNISVHTARTHLKAIFSKTGIQSQSELVRRIANGPAGIRSPR